MPLLPEELKKGIPRDKNWRTLHLAPYHLWTRSKPRKTIPLLSSFYCSVSLGIQWLGTPVAFLIKRSEARDYLNQFIRCQKKNYNDDQILLSMVNNRDYATNLGYERPEGDTTFVSK